MVTQILKLDLGSLSSRQRVQVKQGDRGHVLEIHLMEPSAQGPQVYRVAPDCLAVLAATKPDGSVLYNICDIRDGVLFYNLTQETTSCLGIFPVEIRVYKADKTLLKTASFLMEVGKSTLEDGKIASEDEKTALDTLVSETLAAKNAAEDIEKTLREQLNSGAFQGPQGPKGEPGEKGEPGKDGISGSVIQDDLISRENPWSSYQIIRELCPAFCETGAAVTCSPVLNYPLTVKTELLPRQLGTGTPSLQNIRGFEQLNHLILTQEWGENQEKLQAFIPAGCYGGELDWSGSFRKNFKFLSLDGKLPWKENGDFYYLEPSAFSYELPRPFPSAAEAKGFCAYLAYGKDQEVYTEDGRIYLSKPRLAAQGIATMEALLAQINKLPLLICYQMELIGPDPVRIEGKLLGKPGVNRISTPFGVNRVSGRAYPKPGAEEALKQQVQANTLALEDKASKSLSLGHVKPGQFLTVGTTDSQGVPQSFQAFAGNPALTHNLPRGKFLGNAVTDEQYAHIADGSFEDLYVGDYWTINGRDYVIGGVNYLIKKSADNTEYPNHLAIVPRYSFYNSAMDTPWAEVHNKGYANSAMFATGLNQANDIIKTDFQNHIMAMNLLLSTATSRGEVTNSGYFDVTSALMSEIMVFGCRVASSRLPSNPSGGDVIESSQMPIFSYEKSMIKSKDTYWLRDPSGNNRFVIVYQGKVTTDTFAHEFGVRPYFCIYGGEGGAV